MYKIIENNFHLKKQIHLNNKYLMLFYVDYNMFLLKIIQHLFKNPTTFISSCFFLEKIALVIVRGVCKFLGLKTQINN